MLPHRRWVVALLMLAVATTTFAIVIKQMAFVFWLIATVLIAIALVIELINLSKRRY